MTTYRDTGHLRRAQIAYNTKLSSIRNIIERAFGLLKKIQRLYSLDIIDFDLGNKMIAAACVLHNFIINRGEVDIEEDEENELMAANNVKLHEQDDNVHDSAIIKRDNIVYLFR